MEKNEFDKFILYGIEGNIERKVYIKNAILTLFLSFPLIILSSNHIGTMIWSFIPIIIYVGTLVKTVKGGIIAGKYIFLYNGMLALCFSMEFGMSGIWIIILLFKEIQRVAAITIMIILYIIVYIFYTFIIVHLINKKAYSRIKYTNVTISTTLFGILGIYAGHAIKYNSIVSPIEVLGIICFFLSFLAMLGTINLYKYHYIKKHKELLNNIAK